MLTASNLSRSILLAVCSLASWALAESVIVPGAAWTDTSGNAIQAHGAGILKVGTPVYPIFFLLR